MKKNVFALSFLVFLISAVVLYFIVSFLSKDKENDLVNFDIENAKTQIYLTIPQINKNIENSDDMGLLINIQLLSKLENISLISVLDKTGAAIIPNNQSELHFDASAYTNAARANTSLIQKMDNKNVVLISAPLSGGYTLLCLVSIENAVKSASHRKIIYYGAAGAFDLFIFLSIYLLSRILIIFPFNRKDKALQKVKNEIKKLDEKYYADQALENKNNSNTYSAVQDLPKNNPK
ncbi:MAG: hypothetical protein LBN20_02220 [Endomicrobium sp.]|jgi:hypothetical protein|nr:hypothetical protein [Endomicrobium sp.]